MSPASSSADQPAEPKKLRLDQFLKLVGVAGTGGHAKILIQGGEVRVNGVLEERRGRQLAVGDVVEVDGETHSPDEFLSAGEAS